MYGELFHPIHTERKGSHAIAGSAPVSFYSTKDDAIDFLCKNVWTNDISEKYDAVGFVLFADHVRCPGTKKLFLRLKEMFPSLKFIHIERYDVLESWVSREAAKKTGQWRDPLQREKSENVNDLPIVAGPLEVERFFQSYEEANSLFRSISSKRNYLHVEYNQIVADLEKTFRSIFAFLGVESVCVKHIIKKQRTLTALEQIQNIRELRQFFKRSKYAHLVGFRP